MARSINRKIARVALCALLVTSLLGCSGIRHAPIEPVVASMLSGKEVMVVKRRVPNFGATIRDRAALGFLGVPLGLGLLLMSAIAISSGNTIVQENDIHDPAYQIAEEIAASMGTKYGTKYTGIGNVEISGDDDDVSIVSAVYQSVPLALDVKTIGWGLSYRIVTSNQYHVSFRVRLRLVNTETREAFVEDFCSYRTPADETTTYDELVENGAIHLKEELKKGVRYCVREFSSRYLLM